MSSYGHMNCDIHCIWVACWTTASLWLWSTQWGLKESISISLYIFQTRFPEASLKTSPNPSMYLRLLHCWWKILNTLCCCWWITGTYIILHLSSDLVHERRWITSPQKALSTGCSHTTPSLPENTNLPKKMQHGRGCKACLRAWGLWQSCSMHLVLLFAYWALELIC